MKILIQEFHSLWTWLKWTSWCWPIRSVKSTGKNVSEIIGSSTQFYEVNGYHAHAFPKVTHTHSIYHLWSSLEKNASDFIISQSNQPRPNTKKEMTSICVRIKTRYPVVWVLDSHIAYVLNTIPANNQAKQKAQCLHSQ